MLVFAELGEGTVGNNTPAVNACTRAEVDDAVGLSHGVEVVFDDDESIAAIAELEEGLDELGVITGVEADGRFIEDVEYAGKVGAELGGEPDALGFASGECGGGAVEAEVAESDVIHEAHAGLISGRSSSMMGRERASVFSWASVSRSSAGVRSEQFGKTDWLGAFQGQLDRAAE